MAGLLVSVRSVAEAEIALVGGAALIDIKEPARGALGRADQETITGIAGYVAGRRPVSAALGELADSDAVPRVGGLDFVKWGLAGAARHDWRGLLTESLMCAQPQTVIAAYADWQCAAAPPLDEVVAFATERPGNVLLIDTFCKDPARLSLGRRPTLLDWLAVPDVMSICDRCRDAGVRVALAGSLGAVEIDMLLPARPDWFAVRGAACEANQRQGGIRLAKVRALVAQVRPALTATES